MAMDPPYYLASDMRKFLMDVETDDFTDGQIEDVMSGIAHEIHKVANRATSNPWTSAEDDYEFVKLAIIQGTKMSMLPRENADKDIAERAYKRMLANLTVQGGRRASIQKTTGADGSS